MKAIACIAAEQGSFSHIREMSPMCPIQHNGFNWAYASDMVGSAVFVRHTRLLVVHGDSPDSK